MQRERPEVGPVHGWIEPFGGCSKEQLDERENHYFAFREYFALGCRGRHSVSRVAAKDVD